MPLLSSVASTTMIPASSISYTKNSPESSFMGQVDVAPATTASTPSWACNPTEQSWPTTLMHDMESAAVSPVTGDAMVEGWRAIRDNRPDWAPPLGSLRLKRYDGSNLPSLATPSNRSQISLPDSQRRDGGHLEREMWKRLETDSKLDLAPTTARSLTDRSLTDRSLTDRSLRSAQIWEQPDKSAQHGDPNQWTNQWSTSVGHSVEAFRYHRSKELDKSGRFIRWVGGGWWIR